MKMSMNQIETLTNDLSVVYDLVNIVSLLSRPVNQDINGQGCPTDESLEGSFTAIRILLEKILQNIRDIEEEARTTEMIQDFEKGVKL